MSILVRALTLSLIGVTFAASPAAADQNESAPTELYQGAISAGLGHTCVRLIDGTAKCWGLNGFGQLGIPAGSDRPKPTLAVSLSGAPVTGVTTINPGASNTCMLLDSGGVKCWGGENSDGSHGDGTQNQHSSPVDVSGLSSGVTAISTSGYTTCALLASAVKCWGKNARGELGDGTTSRKLTPTDIGLNNAVGLSVGQEHSCAALSTGEVKCWGNGGYGQLGTGASGGGSGVDKLTPNLVPSLGGVSAVSVGSAHTCALLAAGGVKCWGLNSSGQIGDGSTTMKTTPVSVSNSAGSGSLTGVVAVSSGNSHVCALLSSATVVCWGDNTYGQLGDGTTTRQTRPIAVSGLTGVSAVTAGENHTCALLVAGGVKCWGRGATGVLGNDTLDNKLVPTDVVGLSSGVGPPLSAPGVPGVPTVVAGDGQATVTVVAPGSGGPPATYTVTSSPGNKTCTVTVPATSCVVTDLTNGTSYTFTATAANAAGTSSSSTASSPATPVVAAPGVPGTPTVVVGDGEATITVVAPATGGAPATYTVTSSPGSKTCTVTAPATSCVVTGLTNGTSYTFTVTATNASGTSSSSVASSSSTPTATSSSGGSASSGSGSTSTGSGSGSSAGSGTSGSGSTTGGSVSSGSGTTSGTKSTSASGKSIGFVSGVTKTVEPTDKLPKAIVGTVLNGKPSTGLIASVSDDLKKTDNKVYAGTLPPKTSASSALTVLTPGQAKNADIRSSTPAVCVGAETDLVLIGPGRCDATVVNATTNEVLRVMSTMVLPDTGGTIKVGNKVVVLTPYFFFNGTTKMRPKSVKRFKKSLALARKATTILVTGHSGNVQGMTAGNKALAKNRATTVAKMLKKKKVKAPIAGVGSGPQYPITTSPKRQAANRRVVVVLIP